MEYFSYSRIQKYNRCSEEYRRFYVDEKDDRPITDTVATVNGNVCHSVMEDFYGDVCDRQVDAKMLLDMYWEDRLGGMGLVSLKASMEKVAKDIAWMEWRASPDCKTKGVAIVDRYGNPYKKPKMTTAWRDAWKALKLTERQDVIDQAAAKKDPLWGVVSLSAVFAESYIILQEYKDTLPHLKVLHIEMPITEGRDGKSGNAVLLPFDHRYFKGYIDLVCEDEYGRLYIIDHKTSKMKYTVDKVAHWEQMLLYAWAYHEITGRWVDFIGINGLRQGELVVAELDIKLVDPAVKRFMAGVHGSDARVFIPQSPTEYGSKCYDQWSDTQPFCPYLRKCHPAFADKVGAP